MSWLSVPVDLAIALVGICIGEVDAMRRALRRRPPPIELPPSAACPQCAGDWSKWSTPRERRAGYNSYGPDPTDTVQSRTCKECGFAEERTIAKFRPGGRNPKK